MDFSNFRPVIRMVLGKYMDVDAVESATAELLQSLDVAQALLYGATTSSPSRNVSVETPKKRPVLTPGLTNSTKASPMKGAILISTAPPVAGGRRREL